MLVNLWFPVVGSLLPADHRYALYGALCRQLPALHGEWNWALHTIPGHPDGQGRIAIRNARIGFRMDANIISQLITLAGQTLDISGYRIVLGAPTIEPVAVAPALEARLVTIKHHQEPDTFLSALQAQMASLGVEGEVTVGQRRVLRIADKTVVGFGASIRNLTPEASMLLLTHGLGGRRRMGCGVFLPLRNPA